MPPGEEPLLDALERWLRSTTGVVVPREAWDWAKVPDAPAADLPGRRRRRRRAGPRQGPRGAQGAAAAAVRRRRWPRSPTTAGSRATGADRLDVRRAARGDRYADAGPATRCAAYPGAGRRGRRRSGSGSSARPTRRRRGTGSAYAGCCCWRSPSPVDPTRRGSTTPRSSGLAGSPYPIGRRAARRPAAPRSLRPTSSTRTRRPARPRRTTRWSAAATRRAGARTARGARRRARGCSPTGAQTEKLLSGRAELAHAARAAGHARAAGAGWSHRGFLGEAGADRLRRFPTYLLAIRRRRERLDDRGRPRPRS